MEPKQTKPIPKYQKKTNFEYLINGYCHSNYKNRNIPSAINNIILSYHPKMNGFQFNWKLTNLSTITSNNTFDSDPFDLGLSNKFFLRGNKTSNLFVSRLRELLPLVDDNLNANNISYITRKYVILSIIVVLTTQLSLIAEAFESVTYNSRSKAESITFEIYYMVRALDRLISTLCIASNLEFNGGYNRYLCCQRNNNGMIRRQIMDDDGTANDTTINSSAYSALVGK